MLKSRKEKKIVVVVSCKGSFLHFHFASDVCSLLNANQRIYCDVEMPCNAESKAHSPFVHLLKYILLE